MWRQLSVLVLVFAFTRETAHGFGFGAACTAPQAATDAKFVPGQVWAYRTNSGEEGSRITILRVETLGKVGTIVHVRVDGLHFRNCQGETLSDVLPHAPIARAALEASVTKQIGSVSTLPAFEEGYRDWLSHCGGVYTIPLSQIVTLDEAQYRAGVGCRQICDRCWFKGWGLGRGCEGRLACGAVEPTLATMKPSRRWGTRLGGRLTSHPHAMRLRVDGARLLCRRGRNSGWVTRLKKVVGGLPVGVGGIVKGRRSILRR